MCSRYEINGSFENITLRFNATISAHVIESYALQFAAMAEVRPTNRVPIITNSGEITPLQWGLKVDWDSKPIINARSETLAQKPTFQPILENRCLIPATAYYEWRKDNGQKTKTHLQPNSGDLFAFAGLIEGDTFTMITCAPTPEIAHIHNRMPVILKQADEAKWLTPHHSFKEVAQFLKPYTGKRIDTKEVPSPPNKETKQGDLFD